MKISHKITGENLYIYITIEDIYEFGKENLGKGENSNFLLKLKEYINNNLEELKKTAAIIVINGVVIGSLTLAALWPENKSQEITNNNSLTQVEVYQEKEVEDKKAEEKEVEKADVKEQSVEDTNESNESKENTSVKKESITKIKAETAKKSSTTSNSTSKNTTANKTNSSNKVTSTTNTSQTNTTTTSTNKEDTTSTSNKKEETTTKEEAVESGIKIKFNNGGVISNIDLEDYVIGVVAAEMPAAFHSEALKAQAVAARTYAMKKHSSGVTLINSTAHQVYNSTSQMKSKWGTSYSTYYNKIKNAVNATKGQVLKYGGAYIEASYFAISNGKTELPSYVWSTNFPYLQAVSSSWDEGISAGKYTITLSYSKLSSKLGVNVDKDSEIKIVSRTEGDMVKEISIAGKTFTGVKIRSLLGLRSADFEIVQNENDVTITTIGFGHGVGMSQYGANGAAKAGYSYRQILNHYYPGASIVNI